MAPINFHRDVVVELPFSVVNEDGLTSPKKEKVEEAPVVEEAPAEEVEAEEAAEEEAETPAEEA